MPGLFQHAFYIGNNFNAILYGVELVLYFLTMRAMMAQKSRAVVRSRRLFMAFSTVLLCLNTVFVATEAVFGEEMWISNASYPGGQDAYLVDFASVWYQTFGTAASIVLNLCSDALLLWRCYVIWGDWRIVVLPTILYLGTFSIGIAQLVESGRPHANYFAGLAQKLGVGYTSCIISLNLIVTLLICVRIVFLARQYEASMGRAVARTYTGAVAIIVESALPYSLFGIAYLVSFALKSDVSIFFLSIYVMFTCLSPMMILLRIMSGNAWTSKTSQTIATTQQVSFAGRTGTASTAVTNWLGGEPSKSTEGDYAPDAFEKV